MNNLIGYQFSGVNDEGKNLVPMNAWLNSGNYKGTDEGNQSGMLYYENRFIKHSTLKVRL